MNKEAFFEKGFKATLKYMSEHDNSPNAPSTLVDSDGFKLGMWQSGVRMRYKRKILSSEKIDCLENIGFIWKPREKAGNDSSQKLFQETLRYKEENNGDPHALRKYVTPEGFKLGAWQDNYRKKFARGCISKETAKAFADIGFAWKKQDWEFERHFKATLKYKKQNNEKPNARRKYKTPEGLKLGTWQHYLISSYKSNKLSEDRIKRLEKIGFVWGR